MLIFNGVGFLWILFGIFAMFMSDAVPALQVYPDRGWYALLGTILVLDIGYRCIVTRKKVRDIEWADSFWGKYNSYWQFSLIGGTIFFLPAWMTAIAFFVIDFVQS